MPIECNTSPAPHVLPGWFFLGALLIGASIALRAYSSAFGYAVEVADMPILTLVTFYCLTGLLVAATVPWLVRSSAATDTGRLLLFIIVAGLAMRLVQIGAEPVLADDYNRYLWDGAVIANGHSPYSYSPQDIADGNAGGLELADLSQRAGALFERINYPEYRTIYPPLAQAAFAMSHWVQPFDLNGWRAILLSAELASLALIIATLNQTGRSLLWVCLYWWNPVVIKEFSNSAHMEPLVILPVALAIYLVLKVKPVAASALLGIAAGAKLWPVLLAAPVMRNLFKRPAQLVAAFTLTSAIVAAMAWPIINGGLDGSSGFVAYAQKWQASSAAYPVSAWIVSSLGFDPPAAGAAARLLLGAGLGLIMLASIRATDLSPEALVQRMFWITAAVYLLSPSQFPWYFGWVVPFVCLYPMRGLLLAGALLPLHYLYFYLDARDLRHLYVNGVIWLIWLPVWILLIFDSLKIRRNAVTGA